MNQKTIKKNLEKFLKILLERNNETVEQMSEKLEYKASTLKRFSNSFTNMLYIKLKKNYDILPSEDAFLKEALRELDKDKNIREGVQKKSAEILGRLREELGETREEMAEKLGYSVFYLYKVEIEMTRVSRAFLESLEQNYSLSEEDRKYFCELLKEGKKKTRAYEILNDIKKKNRISFMEMAVKIGFDLNYLSHIGTGYRNVSLEFIKRLSENFPLTEEQIMILCSEHAKDKKCLSFELASLPEEKKNVSVLFGAYVEKLNEKDIEEIKKILMKKVQKEVDFLA